MDNMLQQAKALRALAVDWKDILAMLGLERHDGKFLAPAEIQQYAVDESTWNLGLFFDQDETARMIALQSAAFYQSVGLDGQTVTEFFRLFELGLSEDEKIEAIHRVPSCFKYKQIHDFASDEVCRVAIEKYSTALYYIPDYDTRTIQAANGRTYSFRGYRELFFGTFTE